MSINQKKFIVDIGWKLILNNLGLQAQDLLRHAGLPQDLFSRKQPTLETDEYFRLWTSLEHLLDDPAFSVHVVDAIPVEAFSPPMFATLCSPNLSIALERLAQYKPLIGPLQLNVQQSEGELSLLLEGLPMELPPPASLIAMELVFLVNLARIGTREKIVPKRVTSAVALPPEMPTKTISESVSAKEKNRALRSMQMMQKDRSYPQIRRCSPYLNRNCKNDWTI